MGYGTEPTRQQIAYAKPNQGKFKIGEEFYYYIEGYITSVSMEYVEKIGNLPFLNITVEDPDDPSMNTTVISAALMNENGTMGTWTRMIVQRLAVDAVVPGVRVRFECYTMAAQKPGRKDANCATLYLVNGKQKTKVQGVSVSEDPIERKDQIFAMISTIAKKFENAMPTTSIIHQHDDSGEPDEWMEGEDEDYRSESYRSSGHFSGPRPDVPPPTDADYLDQSLPTGGKWKVSDIPPYTPATSTKTVQPSDSHNSSQNTVHAAPTSPAQSASTVSLPPGMTPMLYFNTIGGDQYGEDWVKVRDEIALKVSGGVVRDYRMLSHEELYRGIQELETSTTQQTQEAMPPTLPKDEVAKLREWVLGQGLSEAEYKVILEQHGIVFEFDLTHNIRAKVITSVMAYRRQRTQQSAH